MALLAKSIGNLFGSMASSFGNNKVQLFQSEDVLNDDLSNKEDSLLEIHKSLTSNEKAQLAGVVSIKIKTCSIDTGLLSAHETFSSIYILIQHRNWLTRTTIVRDHQGKSRFDQVKHFPVNVRS